ncbi:MAG: outer membrane protein assembly factor BamD [Acidobacteriia bacterium]|nr:outer membrane protein assembly factor BamD [Terriglobia bacterium]
MRFTSKQIAAIVLGAALLTASCGFKRKKYDNPIGKDTQQPDKVLFDRAINDIEHGRYEVARLTLNTLINTYDTSEYLAKAKLAIADSWYREGSPHGMAQAEAEYKDFILFYPAMEEAAESQEKICMIHYKQMDKADRDPNNALRAEQECKTLLTQFPNSKFAPEAEQKLREIQEVLADAEHSAGFFYYKKGSNAAAANRFGGLVDQYPLYSRADEALWEEADSYSRMGPRFRQKQGDALSKLVKEYPLSSYADQAKKKLETLEMPIPEADPAAAARMKYEMENRGKPGMVSRATDFIHHGPDVKTAAKSGSPTMTNPKPSIPASIPVPTTASAGFSGDVTVAPVTDPTALDTKPDARLNPPGAAAGTTPKETPATPAASTPSTPSTSTDATAQPPQTPDSKTDSKKNDKKKKKKTDDKSKSTTSDKSSDK